MEMRVVLLYQTSRRVFTLDVALALLELPEREVEGTLPPEHQKFLKHKFLVQEILFARCVDKAPAVRSKALSSFAHCLEFSSTATSESILGLLIDSEYGEHGETELDPCWSRSNRYGTVGEDPWGPFSMFYYRMTF